MIDKAVTQVGNKKCICIRMDGTRVFTEYALEYIDEMLKQLLAEGFLKHLSAEKFDERIKETIVDSFSKAAYLVTIERAADLIGKSSVEELMQIVKDVAKSEVEK